jgi:alcohol dehydrogenase class IV
MNSAPWPDPWFLPALVRSGPGRIETLFDATRTWGKRGCLVGGQSAIRSGLAARIQALSPPGIRIEPVVHTGGEPTLTQLDELRATLRSARADWVAAVGGGSVMDLAKAAAGLAPSSLTSADAFDGAAIDVDPLPFLAAPTTAGTGSEATVNAVLIHPGNRRKKSIRDPRWMPRCVILDPHLLRGCPPAVVADSGLDALTQAIEAYASRHATPFSDGIALEAARLLNQHVSTVFHGRGTDADRTGLLQGSFLAGWALSLARLGIVHGIAHPLGSLYGIPHGRICAVCLPLALDLNRGPLGKKYDSLCNLFGDDATTAIRKLLKTFDIHSPLDGIDVSPQLNFIVQETLASGSCQANCKTVTREDVLNLLRQLGALVDSNSTPRTSVSHPP